MSDISHHQFEVLFRELACLPEGDGRSNHVIHQLQVYSTTDVCMMFMSMQLSTTESLRALQLLSHLLRETQSSWPTLDLIRCHSRLSRILREANPFGDSPASLKCVKDTSELIKNTYQSMAQFIPDEPTAALRPTSAEKFISHEYLRKFVSDFTLPISHNGQRKPVVSIALPNGPLLAAILLATTTHYTAAPINPAAGPQQFQADVLQAGAKCILTTKDDFAKLQLDDEWTKGNRIRVLLVEMDEDMHITIVASDGTPMPTAKPAPPNTADDIALILFTSGTSGTKKVVPITTHSIVAGVVFVIDSWALTSEDVCLNMMPLYHVGGLVRNIFSPIFSGGSTICCPAFDPSGFWDMVETSLPSWYYASPSMHSLILAEATNRQAALERNRIRLVCNAAGGLLPSLATQLRDTFDCVVLPSYGMTECMPISTPPVDYKLDRPGTSGISTGPEMAIFDYDFQTVQLGTVGRICVRGEPLFPGYLQPDGRIDRSPFNEDGWFDTGDMGYMDEDGYLYITGRSKEVINRGGELISPFEVENAIVAASLNEESPLHGRVSQALAFSVQHDVLQEVVGVVLVTPDGVPRPDLRLLHQSLKSSLQQVKWPTLIVYMSDLPKKNNKVMRIKLAERLGLTQLTDDTEYHARHWEGVCPKTDTDLSVPIDCSVCRIDLNVLWKSIACVLPDGSSFCIRMSTRENVVRVILAPSSKDSRPLDVKLPEYVKSELVKTLNGYMMPQSMQTLDVPLPVDNTGNVDDKMLQQYLAAAATAGGDESTVEGRVTKAFASVLPCSISDITPEADFFDLGGDSLRAGRLLSVLRADFSVPIPIDAIFHNGTVQTMSAYIRAQLPDGEKSGKQEEEVFPTEGCVRTYDSTRWWLMAMQLLPMAVFYPMRRAYQWTLFMFFLGATQDWITAYSVPGRLLNLSMAVLFSRTVTNAFAPWIGIAAKWTLIGRYSEGIYPMWGSYHTRWWLVQKIQDICGLGLFSQSNFTTVLYLRLMGAKIGKNVTITHVQTGEWDLIDIGDNVVLEKCTVRPFAGERNTTMYLGRIVIGSNASVGLASIVAPGTTVPENTCIGPNSSSWELQDADESNRDLLACNIPGTHWALTLFVTKPLVLLGWVISLLPWFAGLIGLVLTEPIDTRTPLYSILQWFAATHRVGFHYLALVLRVSISPFILLGFTVVMKWILDAIFGAQVPGAVKGRSSVDKWRQAFQKDLFSGKKLHSVTELLGQHYEGTSIVMRMLGARVGRRVYWPGTGPSIGDPHLLDIGNDVVFGSRSHLITSDGQSSERITIGDRAMIADRVTVLPAVTIGEKTTMGSGALTRRNKVYPDGGTYVGSKKGDAICLNAGTPSQKEKAIEAGFDKSTSTLTTVSEVNDDVESNDKRYNTTTSTPPTAISDLKVEDASPFGRAFYFKQASFRVYGLATIVFYSFVVTILTDFYWNVPSISSIQVVARIFRENHDILGLAYWFDTPLLYLCFSVFIAFFTMLQTVVAIAFVIGAKWYLLGRRAPGNYDWDKSPYCQRWQLYLTIEKLRRYCFRGHGVLGMLTGTHWLVLYFRALGANIGDNCALFANGRPSLMFTEPDLITIGNRVVVDDASVVAHINTRGKFDLNRLEIGDRCVLRTGSRLLSGAVMRDDSALLEHTLIMGGDVVEKGWTMQGWPADRFKGRRIMLRGAGSGRDTPESEATTQVDKEESG